VRGLPTHSARGRNQAVGGTGVLVGGTGVLVGGTGVFVAVGDGVAVAGGMTVKMAVTELP
jgi:hypothetical protein